MFNYSLSDLDSMHVQTYHHLMHGAATHLLQSNSSSQASNASSDNQNGVICISELSRACSCNAWHRVDENSSSAISGSIWQVCNRMNEAG